VQFQYYTLPRDAVIAQAAITLAPVTTLLELASAT
jgi:hypothetical protein